MTKNLPSAVKGYNQILWVLVADKSFDNIYKSEYCMSGHSFAIGKWSYRVIGAVNIGATVNKVDFFFQNFLLP